MNFDERIGEWDGDRDEPLSLQNEVVKDQ